MDTTMKCVDQVVTEDYAIYQGDACELIREIPGDSIDYGIHSPPFQGLYKFSGYVQDLSNSENDDFWEHYSFVISELLRVTKPGRLHTVHCMQLQTSKLHHGFIGMRDFRGEIIRAYVDAGWIYHSETLIRKCPVVAQQRTKSIRLLHAQIVKDSAMSGQVLADYIVTFRKPGENAEPIEGMFDRFIGTGLDISYEAYLRDKREFEANGRTAWPYDKWKSILVWQRYAEVVWMDIDQTRTLQFRGGRDKDDEVHISPLQLDVIERALEIWSIEGETVLTPFLGIGSEVYASVEMGRKGIGFELKPSYFRQAKKNLEGMTRPKTGELFAVEA